MCRFGRSGANLIFPLARTFVETVRMTALVLNWPFVVSISMRVRLHHSIDFTGVAKRIGRGAASFASSAPKPWRQNALWSRSPDREKSEVDKSERSEERRVGKEIRTWREEYQ